MIGLAGIVSATGGFTPPDLSGLLLWLDASQLGLSNNAPVSTWTDASGNGNNAAEVIPGRQPLFKTNGINGKPAVLFDNVDDGMITTLSVVSPYTIFVVAQCGTLSAARRILTGVSVNRLIAFNRDDNSVYLGGPVVTNTGTNPGAAAAVGCLKVGAMSHWYLDGVDRTEYTDLGGVNFGVLALGAEGFSAENLAGYLAEVVIYNSDLSDADRGKVEGYLMSKYAI